MTEITEYTKEGKPQARWAGLLVLPPLAWLIGSAAPPWVLMWMMVGAIYVGCKMLAWPGGPGFLSWVLFWPGMEVKSFTRPAAGGLRPTLREWIAAWLKTTLGSALVWGVARWVRPPLAGGWVGMIGFILLLHFGGLHLLALWWRGRGVAVEPIMHRPLAAVSLADFWGRRWNRGFSDLARRHVYRPLAPRLGTTGANLAVFLFSGIVHELAITVPAGGGYGLPTAYFLAQGLAGLWQRAHRRWSAGGRGRLVTLAVVGGPAFWLFPPVWVHRVFLPFLHFFHAL